MKISRIKKELEEIFKIKVKFKEMPEIIQTKIYYLIMYNCFFLFVNTILGIWLEDIKVFALLFVLNLILLVKSIEWYLIIATNKIIVFDVKYVKKTKDSLGRKYLIVKNAENVENTTFIKMLYSQKIKWEEDTVLRLYLEPKSVSEHNGEIRISNCICVEPIMKMYNNGGTENE